MSSGDPTCRTDAAYGPFGPDAATDVTASTVVMTTSSPSASCRIRPIAPSDRDGARALLCGPVTRLARGEVPRRFAGHRRRHGPHVLRSRPRASGRPRRRDAPTRTAGGPSSATSAWSRSAQGDVEMAIAVADGWQHHGLGRAMLARAIAWARGHGVAELSASIRWSNGAMIGLIRSLGLPMTFVNQRRRCRRCDRRPSGADFPRRLNAFQEERTAPAPFGTPEPLQSRARRD